MHRLATPLCFVIACTGNVGALADAGHPPGALDSGIAQPGDAGTDAGAPPLDAGPFDAGRPDAGRVSVIVAIGKMGRRTVSCDDGLTWAFDFAVDELLPPSERYPCGSGDHPLPDGGVISTECFHHPWATTGIAFGDGTFVASWGHGQPGTVSRSTDGVHWQDVLAGPQVATMLFNNGVFLGGSKRSIISTDLGATWDAGVLIDFTNGSYSITNCRSGVSGSRDAGTFVLAAGEGINFDFAVTHDRLLAAWHRPIMTDGGRVDLCGSPPFASGNGVLVGMSPGGIACRSTDDGETWDAVGLAPFMTAPVWSGTAFAAWSNGGGPRLFKSVDGATWSTTPISTVLSDGGELGNLQLGQVGVTPGGAYVAVVGAYQGQLFLRSTDGVLWRALPAGAFNPSHPIDFFASGDAVASDVCPAK